MGNIFPKIFLKTKEKSSQNNVLWPQEGATPPSVGSSTLASTWQCEWRFCASYIIRIYPDSPWWHYKLTLLIRSGISITSLRHLDQASSLIFGGRGQNARLNCSKKKKSFEVVNLNAINLYSFSEALLHIAHISQSINSHFRRYLTRLQMAQFVIFFAHAMQPLFIECDYPKVPSWWSWRQKWLWFDRTLQQTFSRSTAGSSWATEFSTFASSQTSTASPTYRKRGAQFCL